MCVEELTNLLGLHRSSILPAEAQLGDGHVIKDDVEVLCPLIELSPDEQRHLYQNTYLAISNCVYKHCVDGTDIMHHGASQYPCVNSYLTGLIEEIKRALLTENPCEMGIGILSNKMACQLMARFPILDHMPGVPFVALLYLGSLGDEL